MENVAVHRLTPVPLHFLAGGGSMGAAIRAFDWSRTPLGPPTAWPPNLQTLVGVILAAEQPMILAWGAERTLLYNDRYRPMLGRKHPALGRPLLAVWSEVRETLTTLCDRVFAGESVQMDDIALMLERHECAKEAHFAFSYTPVRDDLGAVVGLFCACTETTDAVAATACQKRAYAQLAEMFDQAPGFIVVLRGPEHRFELVNAAYLGVVGKQDFIGKTVMECLPTTAEQGYIELLDTVFRTGKAFKSQGRKYVVETPPGAPVDERFLDFIYQPITDVTGRVTGIFVEGSDVTDRTLSELALRETEAQLRDMNATLEQRVLERTAALQLKDAFLRSIFETSHQLQALLALDGTLLDTNAASLAAIEARLEDVVGRPYWDLPWFADTPDMPEVVRAGVAAAAAGQTINLEVSLSVPAGVRFYDFSLRPICDAQGAVIAIAPEAVDITERRRTEEALCQSQKLEAIGKLTGGVAHDFNNLLTPIIGGLDMLKSGGLGGPREQRLIDGALQAADRARTLVQRLLAFARRQPLQPVAVDVASLVTNMAGLIASTSGPHIKVTVRVGDGLPTANADPNQLEMAILNLCVNARDAMAAGGRLRITATDETIDFGHRSGLPPGRYVRISVADTGTGMDDATLQRAVDPFFSTKGVGQGTGLGLSMAHGLASQLGGALTLSSKPGLGTNVELRLPMSTGPLQVSPVGGAGASSAGAGGTALLVDDEDAVRTSTAAMLAGLGIVVREASSAEEALRAIDSGLRFDMLITDHLMPGMTGGELAQAICERRPGTPVLIVSGFAEAEGIAPELPRLAKPFRQSELADSVADILARPR